MQTELERHADCVLLRLKGDMRLWSHPEQGESMMSKFRSALEAPPPQRLVLSLAEVTHVDTMGISSLVRILVDCSKREIKVRLVMPEGVAADAMRRVRIFEPWPAFPDEQAALQETEA